MVSVTLVTSSILVLGVSLFYFIVGRAVLDPTAPRPERLARNAFGLWWFALAAYTVEGAMDNLLAASGIRDISMYASLEYMGLTFLFVGLAGLMYYLLYLYTGRSWIIYPISLFYGLFLLIGFYVRTLRGTAGLDVGAWEVELIPVHEVSPLLISLLQGALILPLIVGVLLYFLLYFMVETRLQKQRILLVGGALLFWFGTTGIAAAVDLTDAALWGLVSRVIALIAASVILYAFTLLERKHRPQSDFGDENGDSRHEERSGSPYQKAMPVFQVT